MACKLTQMDKNQLAHFIYKEKEVLFMNNHLECMGL